MAQSREENQILIEKFTLAPPGTCVEGIDSSLERVTWRKDWDDLWSSGTGMRVNSRALPGWITPTTPDLKLPKGVTKDSPTLFG